MSETRIALFNIVGFIFIHFSMSGDDFAKDRLSGQAMSTSKKSSIKNSSSALALQSLHVQLFHYIPFESRDADTEVSCVIFGHTSLLMLTASSYDRQKEHVIEG